MNTTKYRNETKRLESTIDYALNYEKDEKVIWWK